MAVQIQVVASKSDAKKFVDFPFQLYKNDKMWVPPLKSDEMKSLNPLTNPAFEEATAQFWIAILNGKVVGRIGAIINHGYNQERNEMMGRFSRFECIDDPDVAHALLKRLRIFTQPRHGGSV